LALPGGASVPVWGFAQLTAGQTCADVTAHVPGPVLDVAAGDAVTITLHNDLAEPVSLELPGEAVTEGGVEAPAGLTATYTFTAPSPGTFVYQSASNAGRQIAMGLYGALVVRPTTSGRAYADASTAYDTERMLVLSAIDPALNANPDTFDMRHFAPTYWLINGKSYPDTSEIHVSAGQRLLLRYVNAGFDNTTMALLGAHERVVGSDAFALPNPFDAIAETIPAGATMDAILTVPSAGRFPIYNRQLHLTNGPGSLGTAGYAPGGMMTFVVGT
jgi:FtsP/CotA-like multicopper oxidase with cupredoxin domain